ncbi:MAG: thioredoxin domain-containing protein, partial [Anaerolineae bacterium]|nr:thioredoxin domain-containing protein [Anaerolineae bacterium]
MLKRHTALILALLLILSLFTGTVASGAPNPDDLTQSDYSASMTSVRLTESIVWRDTGLILNLPEGWETKLATLDGDETIIATPKATGNSDLFQIIQASTVDSIDYLDLPAIAELTALDYDLTSTIVETTVAGYPAVTYEFRDTEGRDALYMRALMIDVTDQNAIGLIIFATDENTWDEFRPTVSAVASSIQRLNSARSALMPIARTWLRQDDEADNAFTWEEVGASFVLPAGWIAQNGSGSDFDIALISPAVQTTGEGSFVKLRFLPMMGSTPAELATAIQPLSEQLGNAEIKNPYVLGDLEGAGINYVDEESGYIFHFVLLPYGDRGDTIYIQSTAAPDEDEAVVTMLRGIELNVIVPNYAAIDAAWQASLAENGTLTFGNPEAPMQIAEYLSFTCGHCVNYSRSIEHLLALDVETGKVLFTLALLAGDDYAALATHATYCAAEQGKGYSMAEALFASYHDLGYDVAYTRDNVNELASEFDLDSDALNACIDEER